MTGERLEGISDALAIVAEALRPLSTIDARAVLALASAVISEPERAGRAERGVTADSPTSRERVLTALSSEPRGLAEIREAAGLSQGAASKSLRALEADGRVVNEGSGRASTWRLA